MARAKAQNPTTPIEPFIPDPPENELGEDLFSRKFKYWREWKNAVDFLTNLHINVDDAQVLCSPQDPPDVLYRDAAFEVKEIMDAGRRRHDEAKCARQKSMQATGKKNFTLGPVIDLLPADAAQLVLEQLDVLAERYLSDVRARTDLLFHINKINHWFDDGPMPNLDLFEPYGWRSVSVVVANSVSIVFQAGSTAPQFLRDNLGKVRHRCEPL